MLTRAPASMAHRFEELQEALKTSPVTVQERGAGCVAASF